MDKVSKLLLGLYKIWVCSPQSAYIYYTHFILYKTQSRWQLCFPLLLNAGRSDFRLYDGSDLKTYLLMRWLGPDALAVCQAHRVYLLDFFCSGIQFNLLLSPYPCFISLLYLDLYVLGDDALIS